MSASFKSMKKSRMGFEDLASKMEKEESNKGYGDKNPNLWYPELDKAKNGYAVIRFLPEKDTDFPWVKTYSHGFKVKGKWFIDECPTTIDEKCPVCEANTELWNSGIESDKDIARDRKRRQSWYANILVVEDPKNPENEGKVKIFKFGYKIYSKLIDKLQPPEAFADEVPVNVCDFWEGADFKLKIRKVDNQVNYDASSFIDPAPIADNDKEIEKIWDQFHDISSFSAVDKYKTYDDLKKRFDQVSGTKSVNAKTAEDLVEESVDGTSEKAVAAASAENADAPKAEASVADADDTMAFFNDLAENEG